MLPEYRVYMVRGEDNLEYGPVDMEELREWVQENRAGLGTSVRYDEPGSTWHPWQDYPELVALLAEARVTGANPYTPPGLVIAPLGSRMVAGIVDFILGAILSFPLLFASMFLLPTDLLVKMMTASQQSPHGPPPELPTFFIFLVATIFYGILIFYQTCFHAAHGQTPAMSILRLRVVTADGCKPSFVKSLLRAIAFYFSIFYLWGFPLTYAFLNPQRRTFHDFVAGTYVVEA